MLLGSTSVKAASKTLMKLTPGLNFINILDTALTLEDPKSVKKTVKSFYALDFWNLRVKKLCVNMLMKSTSSYQEQES
jgi:hypothetical protein